MRIYYKYRLDDVVFGVEGKIPNSNLQMLGLDFDDKLSKDEITKFCDWFSKKNKIGRWSLFETSKGKYYVWFFDSAVPYGCDCKTILNLARKSPADDNYKQWLMSKDCSVMRLDRKKFMKEKPKFVKEGGRRILISDEQEAVKNFVLDYLGVRWFD